MIRPSGSRAAPSHLRVNSNDNITEAWLFRQMTMLPNGLLLRPRVRNLAQCIVHYFCVLRRLTREREEIVQLRLDLG
jgi:hypothetical protein